MDIYYSYRFFQSSLDLSSIFFHFSTDIDTRGLERSSLHWNGEDIIVGSAVLHLPNDVWKLRTVQFTCCHSCRGIFFRGKVNIHCDYNFHCINVVTCYQYECFNLISHKVLRTTKASRITRKKAKIKDSTSVFSNVIHLIYTS